LLPATMNPPFSTEMESGSYDNRGSMNITRTRNDITLHVHFLSCVSCMLESGITYYPDCSFHHSLLSYQANAVCKSSCGLIISVNHNRLTFNTTIYDKTLKL